MPTSWLASSPLIRITGPALADYERIVRPYVDAGQQLPPGGIRTYAPQSQRAIWARWMSARLMASRPLRGLTRRLFFNKAGAIDCPSTRPSGPSPTWTPLTRWNCWPGAGSGLNDQVTALRGQVEADLAAAQPEIYLIQPGPGIILGTQVPGDDADRHVRRGTQNCAAALPEMPDGPLMTCVTVGAGAIDGVA